MEIDVIDAEFIKHVVMQIVAIECVNESTIMIMIMIMIDHHYDYEDLDYDYD